MKARWTPKEYEAWLKEYDELKERLAEAQKRCDEADELFNSLSNKIERLELRYKQNL